MDKRSRRHTNNDFLQPIGLIIADVLMSGILGIIFLGIGPQFDKGLLVKLSPYSFEMGDTLEIVSSDILHLDIDSDSQLFIDEIPFEHSKAEINIHHFILRKFLTKSKCYLWVRVSRHSKYRYYIQLQDSIKRAEKKLLDYLSIKNYGVPYSAGLPLAWRRKLKRKIAICIIEEDELNKPYFTEGPASDCYGAREIRKK